MFQKLCTSLLIFTTLLACKEESTGKKSINPNGDSELALLMREMYDDGMLTKQQILEGKQLEIGFDFRQVHTATPTEEGKNESTEYMLMAKAYEAAVDSLLAADQMDRPHAYQNMVNTCANCHQTMCPGPLVKIKKMYLTEPQLLSLTSPR